MLRSSLAAPILVVAVFISPALADTAQVPVATLIAEAKAALGGPALDKATNWHERGALHAGGIDGRYETWVDLKALKSVAEYSLGPASGAQGWDGAQVWSTDSEKAVRVERSGESVANAIQDTYRSGFGFLFPERYPATIESAGTKIADGISYDAIKVTPKGADPFEVWFDRGTHLIAREVQLGGAQPHSFLFTDWKRVAGVLTPWKTIDRTGEDAKYDVVGEAQEIELSIPLPDSKFAPPAPPKDDTSWPEGQDSVTVPFRLINNHIYVEASIDGAKPVPFVFDTGAIDVIEAEHAKRMGLKSEGELPGAGFGDAVASFGFVKAKSVSLGGLTLPNPVFGSMAMGAFGAVEGTDSTGLLGYEFARRAVLTVDYAARTLTFTKQAQFHPPAGATAIPFTFQNHTPMVEASVDGISGEFEVDTGARSSLTLMHPFVEANKLVEKYHATRLATVGYGVGGPSRALLGRAGSLKIGPVELKAPVAELVTDTRGAGASTHVAGNIGGDLLKRFTVTLDYAHQQLWLVPNALAGQPDLFDRSGLWLQRNADGSLAIGDVSQNSAASAAGLTTDDTVTAVDGKPTSGLDLSDLRERLKGAPGTKIDLTVKGKTGTERAVALTLADQV